MKILENIFQKKKKKSQNLKLKYFLIATSIQKKLEITFFKMIKPTYGPIFSFLRSLYENSTFWDSSHICSEMLVNIDIFEIYQNPIFPTRSKQ